MWYKTVVALLFGITIADQRYNLDDKNDRE